MANYIARRTIRAIVTLWIVVTFIFGMIRLLPGGPLTQLRGKLIRAGYPPSQINTVIETYQNLQPDAPLYLQYYQYMISVIHGDFGQSIVYSQSVAAIVGDALPWTVFVMVIATALIFIIAIVWGAIMAYYEGSTFDIVSSVLLTILASIPFYVLALGLIIVFAYKFNIFPVRNRTSAGVTPNLSLSFLADAVYHAVLPILAVVITGVGLQSLSMRGNSIQVLGEDYVRVARLRGLPNHRIAVRYVGRNAILPMYTAFLTVLGSKLGGSVILEQIFTYPGIGYYLFKGLQNRDYPLMMGIFLVMTIALVLAVYIADLTYGRLDPRIKSGDSNDVY